MGYGDHNDTGKLSLRGRFDIGKAGYCEAQALGEAVKVLDLGNAFGAGAKDSNVQGCILVNLFQAAKNGDSTGSVAVVNQRAAQAHGGASDREEKAKAETRNTYMYIVLLQATKFANALTDNILKLEQEINFLQNLASDMVDWDELNLSDDQKERIEQAQDMLGVSQEDWDAMTWAQKIEAVQTGKEEREVKQISLKEARLQIANGEMPDIQDDKFVNEDLEAVWQEWVAEDRPVREQISRTELLDIISNDTEFRKSLAVESINNNDDILDAGNYLSSEAPISYTLDEF